MPTIPVQHLNRSLEPPGIQMLAQALADETWLDIRVVDAGVMKRVKIEALHIYRQHETVTVVQEVCEEDPEELIRYSFEVEAEDIMYAVKTELESVNEVDVLLAPAKKPNGEQELIDKIRDAAIQAVVDVTGGTVMELVRGFANASYAGRRKQELVDRRHLVLWTMIEMTDETPYDLCWYLGWRSPMPYQTALYKFISPNADKKWAKIITEVVGRTRKVVGLYKRDATNHYREFCIT